MTKSTHRSAALRERRKTLLPQITQLARAGHNSREIGEKLGIAKTTVHRWLRKMGWKFAAEQPLDPAEVIRKHIAHYRSIYRKAIKGWNDSQAEKQVRVVEDTTAPGDAGSKKKRSLRTETQRGDAACLTKAMEARKAIDALEQRLAALERSAAAAPVPVEELTDEDLENMTDAQLAALDARLAAENGPAGGSVPLPALSDDDLHAMTAEQLRALELQLLDEIQRAGDVAEPQ
jgi:hypothetical protein